MIGKVPVTALERRSKDANREGIRTLIGTSSMWNYEAREGLKRVEEKKKQKEKEDKEIKIDVNDLKKNVEKLSISDDDRGI